MLALIPLFSALLIHKY